MMIKIDLNKESEKDIETFFITNLYGYAKTRADFYIPMLRRIFYFLYKSEDSKYNILQFLYFLVISRLNEKDMTFEEIAFNILKKEDIPKFAEKS
jgi:hypothetical protein